MFGLSDSMAVYVHRGAVDFRKSINGLVALVEQQFGYDPFAQALFVFANKRRDKIKILYWQRNGFWLCYKRLEQERFIWPRREEALMELSVQQLQWLLEGFDLNAMKGHQTVAYRRAS